VTFSVGGTTLCTTGPLAAGSASCAASNAPVGADTVTGTYTGDSTFAASTGTTSLDVTYPSTTAIFLTESTPSTGYGSAGQTVPFSYLVTDTGTTSLTSISVSDTLVPSVSCPSATLAAGGSETCTGVYTVTQGDVDAGSVTSAATASGFSAGAGVVSDTSSVTVDASSATSAISLTESTASTGYGSAGQTVAFSDLVTDTGTTTLTGVSVGGTPVTSVTCPSATLTPGGSETCTGSYAVTQGDLSAGSVTSAATASGTNPHGKVVTSAPFSVTVPAANCDPPVVMSAGSETMTAGTASVFTVTTCSTKPPVIKGSGLPQGLSLVNKGNGTATVSGTPAARDDGIYRATITASVAGQPLATQTFVVTVDHGPVLKTSVTYTAKAGTAMSSTITALYTYPIPAITTSSTLPAGVTLTDRHNGTAVLAGTIGATAGGVYPITITVANGVGSPANELFTLTVDQVPVITSPANDTITAGSAMTPFTLTAIGYPAAKLGASGLPSGLRLVDNPNGTGTISGTPKPTAGTYHVTITATSKAGSTSQAFTLTAVP